MELPKTYNSQDFEDKIYQDWEKRGLFKPEVNESGAPFCIILPPPNATGELHLGHATMIAIQDLLIRHARMQGKSALWLPGTDHAAIATQSKVEKIIKKEEGKTRHDLGREQFLERVKQYVAQSQDTIRKQMRKMGASLDWSRERYTLSDELSRVVSEVFLKMHGDGLIYRGHRIVNWDPIGQTTVADDEIVYEEEQGKFYTFQYGPFQIATARPETKFGDKYVVMHPDDQRYAEFKHGQKLELEWINGPITATVIKDAATDMNFGTGVMTITPWHDQTDFDIAQRHNLDKEQIIGFDGKLLPIAGEFAGLPIEEARPQIVAKLEKKGLLVKIEENYRHNIARSDRFGGLIEPQVKEQWFVDVNKKVVQWQGATVSLKEMMQDAVRSKAVNIVPERFSKTYFNWVDNLRDWCISRQIWWGHRIPVWYKDGEMKAQLESPGAGWQQDPDTLDTWFSSAFWTWSTLIDPKLTQDASLDLAQMLKQSPDFQKFHPTDVLETGYDILFFWVARMILMTGYVTGAVPFKNVYLHGLVRDKNGKKMSKSLGNGIDPLEVIPKYGTDAIRLSLVIGTTPGNDNRVYEEKIAGFRNFVNKLWNIARFILSNIKEPQIVSAAPVPQTVADQWILSRLQRLIAKVSQNINEYNFSQAGEDLYAFTWNELADWYVEDSKIEGGKDQILLYVLSNLLKLWHPYTPFVTEVLWQNMGGKDLIIASWPQADNKLINGPAEKAYQQYQEILTAIRNGRAEFSLPYTQEIKVAVEGLKESSFAKHIISRAKLSDLFFVEEIKSEEKSIAYHLAGGIKVHLYVDGLIDFAKEALRLKGELKVAKDYQKDLEKKLGNKEFVANAPKAIVQAQKDKLEETLVKIKSIEAQIQALS